LPRGQSDVVADGAKLVDCAALSQKSGFYASTLVIILLSGFLYWLFKRKDWL
jgi:Mg2+ and Co2+ transporter CorA